MTFEAGTAFLNSLETRRTFRYLSSGNTCITQHNTDLHLFVVVCLSTSTCAVHKILLDSPTRINRLVKAMKLASCLLSPFRAKASEPLVLYSHFLGVFLFELNMLQTCELAQHLRNIPDSSYRGKSIPAEIPSKPLLLPLSSSTRFSVSSRRISRLRSAFIFRDVFKYLLSTMEVSKKSNRKFLIGNRFQVKLRILNPEICKQRLRTKS